MKISLQRFKRHENWLAKVYAQKLNTRSLEKSNSLIYYGLKTDYYFVILSIKNSRELARAPGTLRAVSREKWSKRGNRGFEWSARGSLESDTVAFEVLRSLPPVSRNRGPAQ